MRNPIGHDGIIYGYFNRVVKYLEHLTAVISERMSWNMRQCMELAEFTLIYIGEYLSDLTPIAVNWRNDTYNLCHLAVFIPKSVRP